MGTYVNAGPKQGKVAWLLRNQPLLGAIIVADREDWVTFDPKQYGLVAVVGNPTFDAAGWAFDESERDYFADPASTKDREVTFLIMELVMVQQLTATT